MERKRKIYTYRDERETRERGGKEKREPGGECQKRRHSSCVCGKGREEKRKRKNITCILTSPTNDANSVRVKTPSLLASMRMNRAAARRRYSGWVAMLPSWSAATPVLPAMIEAREAIL